MHRSKKCFRPYSPCRTCMSACSLYDRTLHISLLIPYSLFLSLVPSHALSYVLLYLYCLSFHPVLVLPSCTCYALCLNHSRVVSYLIISSCSYCYTVPILPVWLDYFVCTGCVSRLCSVWSCRTMSYSICLWCAGMKFSLTVIVQFFCNKAPKQTLSAFTKTCVLIQVFCSYGCIY